MVLVWVHECLTTHKKWAKSVWQAKSTGPFLQRHSLKCNRFWRNISVISAEVNTRWTELQGKRSPPIYTLDKFLGSEGHFLYCVPLPDLYGSAYNIFTCVIDRAWGQNGCIGRALFFLLRFYGLRRSHGPLKSRKRTRLISSNLDHTSLVNRVYILLA